MKDADSMTPEELRALANKKEEDEILNPTVKKTGVLKHDLYTHNLYNISKDTILKELDWLTTKEEIDKVMGSFKIEKVLLAGTVFECYGEDDWNDTIGETDCMPDWWADLHLENIKDVNK